MVTATRDVRAYRAKKSTAANAERIAKLKEASKIKSDTRKCYIEYRPPQIRFERAMRKCLGMGEVMPVFRSKCPTTKEA